MVKKCSNCGELISISSIPGRNPMAKHLGMETKHWTCKQCNKTSCGTCITLHKNTCPGCARPAEAGWDREKIH